MRYKAKGVFSSVLLFIDDFGANRDIKRYEYEV